MKKYIMLIIAVAVFSVTCKAQKTLRQATSGYDNAKVTIVKTKEKTETIRTPRLPDLLRLKPNSEASIDYKKTYSNDTIYCTRTKKQHGWFAPLDTISKEIALHRNYSIRFTMKNQSGNWERFECINAYGKHTKGTLAPYILKLGDAANSDSGADVNWIDKLKNTCIYECISDASGKEVIQERAYDENMNIVYTFSHIPVGSNQYIGSYRDYLGLPAEMRKDLDYTYGTLVKLTEDKWGNDSVVQYIDAKGLPKLNSDSVALEIYIHDKYGHLLKQQSCNIDGSLTTDNWGNCGIEYTWNTDHQAETATYMDENWQPMRMPAIRERTGRENVIRTNYNYDVYFRQIEEFYTDQNGKPDANTLGTHKLMTEYDSIGNQILQYGLDIKGNLSPTSLSGSVKEIYEFDDDGNMTKALFCDKDNMPYASEGYLSKVMWKYNNSGEEISKEQYHMVNGKEQIYYRYCNDKNMHYTQWEDGSYRIDSLDHKGRLLFKGFYNSYGEYEMNGGRAYEIYTYEDNGKVTTSEETDYDENGRFVDVDGTCKTITVSDSLNWTESKWRYDSNGILKETFVHRYTDNFDKLIGQDDMNEFGVLARSGGSSGVRYYKGNVLYNHKGEFSSIYGVDEFGEPDYITSNSVLYYYQKKNANRWEYYDANNRIIDDFSALRDSLPKVMTIEVVDSIAYQLGLKDNDVILRYGQYANDIRDHSNTHVRNAWGLYSVLAVNKEKDVVIYRIDEKNPDGVIVNLKLPKGSVSQLGFIPHIRYLTDKQSNRIKNVLGQYKNDHSEFKSELDIWFDTTMNDEFGDKEITLVYPELYRANREKPYPHYVKDAGILIGYYVPESGDYWLCDGTTDKIDSLLNHRVGTSKYSPHIVYYFTTDMSNVSILNSYENYISGNWSSCNICDDNYNLLSGELVKFVNKDVKNRIKKGKKTKSIDEANKLLRNSYSNLYTLVDNDGYKGVEKVELYDFSNSYSLRDSAYEIVESIASNKKEQYSFESRKGYGSICLMSSQKTNRINKCFVFTSKTLIYIEGEFSQVQLNKISNLLK